MWLLGNSCHLKYLGGKKPQFSFFIFHRTVNSTTTKLTLTNIILYIYKFKCIDWVREVLYDFHTFTTCFSWLEGWTSDSQVHILFECMSLISSQIFSDLLSRIREHGYIMEIQVPNYDLHVTGIGGTGLSIKP
jgi:hypothetical protein